MNEIRCSICNYPHKLSSRVYKKHLNKNTFKCRSCIIKNKWKDPEYKRRIKKSQSNIWSSEETKKKISLSLMKLWENPDYRKNQIEFHSNPLYKSKTADISKKLWDNKEFRSNQIKIRNDPDWKNKQSCILKEVWNRPGYKQKMAGVAADFLKLNKRSSIEQTTGEILNLLGIDFQEQKNIGPYIFDFYIPEGNLLIECQGEYWHSFTNIKKKDSAKFTYINEHFPDFKILYLHERDFLNPGIIKQKISSFGFSGSQSSIDFSFCDLHIELFDNDSIHLMEKFLNSYHYAQSGRNCKRSIGAYLDDQLIAVCKFTSVIRKEVATSLNLKTSEVLELDRFCIHPNYQKKNFASWFISRCVKLIYTDLKNITHLVSFADSTFGHSGTIYKAANWTEIGKVKPSYHYINKDGWVLHKKTLYNHAVKMKKTEREYAEEFGYIKVPGKEKIKFILKK